MAQIVKLSYVLLLLCVASRCPRGLCAGWDSPSETDDGTDSVEGTMDSTEAPPTTTTQYDTFVQSVRYQESEGRKWIAQGLKNALPMMMRMGHEAELSNECQMAYFKILMGLKDLKLWALKMVDSSAKIPSGILEGSLVDLGAYNECVDIVAGDDGREFFRGQYCAFNIKPYLPPKPKKYNPQIMFENITQVLPIIKSLELDTSLAYMYFLKFRFGLCIPSACDIGDVRKLGAHFGSQIKMNITVPWCETKEDFTYPAYFYAVLGIFLFFLFIAIVGTLLDIGPQLCGTIRRRPQPEKPPAKGMPRKLLEAFSAYSNGKKILSTSTNDHRMRCLHGIRFLSMTWVMLGHVYYSRNNTEVLGAERAKGLGKDLAFQVVLNATLSVDTFFFLSGALLMYVCYGKLKKDKGRFDFLMYYLHRYIRLTPPFLMVSMILLLDSYWWNGPLWHETVDRFINGCHRYWWTNLLYISSWMKTEEVCLPHGWYLSCDMQYFILAPIFFVSLYRKPVLGFSLIVLAAFASMAVTGMVTYIYDVGPVALFSIPDDDNVNMFLNYIGFRPYTHFASFAIGLILGYLVYKYKEIKISRKMQLVGWLSAVTTGLTVLYGIYDWNANKPPGTFLSIAYGCTSRPAWVLCVAWVTFACITGHGGFVNTLLSWKAFVPLSKMTFMVYLLHPPLMFAYAAHVINAIYVTQFMVVYAYLAHITACYLCAFVACILWESPFINVEKVILDAVTDWRGQRRKAATDHAEFPVHTSAATLVKDKEVSTDRANQSCVVPLSEGDGKAVDSPKRNITSIRL